MEVYAVVSTWDNLRTKWHRENDERSVERQHWEKNFVHGTDGLSLYWI